MEAMEELLRSHGYALLILVGFAEFAGLPLASGPVLVLAGAFAARGAMELHWAIAAAVSGALIADLCWYAMARRYGGWVLGVACGLASNPSACAIGLRAKIERAGSRSVLVAKLIPGMANLVAASAGLARLPVHRFIPANLAGLLFWASLGLGLGWIFSDRLQEVIGWLSSFSRIVLIAAGGLILGAAVWRIVKIGMHRRRHPARAGSESGAVA
jgi:membrane protein DedA with SNARE-associated domain